MNQNNYESREQDVDALIAILDGCVQTGESRIKVDVVEGEGKVEIGRAHV